ncbi:MAG: hypothetical protein ACREA3_05825 [Nitrosotalea sp.]
MNTIKINRTLQDGTYLLEEIFEGLKDVDVLLQIFGTIEELDDVFSRTKVMVDVHSHYMHVKNDDAIIVIGTDHLKKSDKIILYLDIVHELVHVKQQRRGLDLYDKLYSYVDRPTEIEAYTIAIEEAKRLGMKDDEIFDYLHVEWITPEEHKRLASNLGLMYQK